MVGVIAFLTVCLCLAGTKMGLDNYFQCTDDDYTIVMLPGMSEDFQNEAWNTEAHTYSSFLVIGIELKKDNYETFKKEFYDFYISCDDESKYLAIRNVFFVNSELSDEQCEVLLSVLEECNQYDEQNFEKNNYVIQKNLLLRSEIHYAKGEIREAFELRHELDEHVSKVKTEAKKRIEQNQ